MSIKKQQIISFLMDIQTLILTRQIGMKSFLEVIMKVKRNTFDIVLVYIFIKTNVLIKIARTAIKKAISKKDAVFFEMADYQVEDWEKINLFFKGPESFD